MIKLSEINLSEWTKHYLLLDYMLHGKSFSVEIPESFKSEQYKESLGWMEQRHINEDIDKLKAYGDITDIVYIWTLSDELIEEITK